MRKDNNEFDLEKNLNMTQQINKQIYFRKTLIKIISSLSFIVSLTAFIIFGLIFNDKYGPYNLPSWGICWVSLLFGLSIPSFVAALIYKKLSLIPVTLLSIAIYFLVSLLTGLFHPLWVIFIGAILFQIIAKIIDDKRY